MKCGPYPENPKHWEPCPSGYGLSHASMPLPGKRLREASGTAQVLSSRSTLTPNENSRKMGGACHDPGDGLATHVVIRVSATVRLGKIFVIERVARNIVPGAPSRPW